MRHFNPIDHDRWTGWEVVAYHGHCADGLAAAATVLEFLEKWLFRFPKFVPISYGKGLPPEILAGGQSLLFVDFCLEREEIQAIEELWGDWFVIDHHKSRDWIVSERPNNCVFDMDKSGATLAREWLFGDTNSILGQPVRESNILQYVQDRDLWQWRLPCSREVSAALKDWEPDVETWHRNIYEEPISINDLVSVGSVILRQVERYAKSRAKKCYPVEIGEMPVLLCNATQHMSEVAEQILESNPEAVAAVFWQDSPDQISLSFRSRDGADITALDVARSLGGGGHQNAAGARIPTYMRGEW